LTSNSGVEHIELTGPWKAVHEAGGEPVLIAPKREPVHTVEGHEDSGVTFDPSATVSDASVGDFAGLVIPGGVANPDALRLIPDAVEFVRAAVDARLPVASICHGPWMLVEADVLGGKTLTSWPSLATDIRNAGGTWQDVEVFTCTANDWTLVTSRKPGDLDAFSQATIAALAGSD
jgi:protease I